MSAPQEVLDLVSRFTENLAACASGAYNEARLRRECGRFFNLNNRTF